MTNEPTQEDVIIEDNAPVEETEEQSTETTEETTEPEVKKELTDDQKKGIAKRNLKKILKEHPDLLREKDEPVAKQSDEPLSRDEAILIAKGVEPEGLDKIKRIAAIDGISLDEAYKSEDYTLYVEKQERVAKQKASQLEVSGGGTRTKKEKTLGTAGLSRDEHKALAEKARKKLEGK